MVVIWNPLIRKSVGIVVPSELSENLTRFDFGVCPSTYDPTIVAIYKCLNENKHKVGIFTLRSKTWKMIPSSNVLRESVRLESSTRVAIDRFIFWVTYELIFGDDAVSPYKSFILSFDLITYEFKEVQLSDSIVTQAPQDISISKLNESLVVSAYTNEVVATKVGCLEMDPN